MQNRDSPINFQTGESSSGKLMLCPFTPDRILEPGSMKENVLANGGKFPRLSQEFRANVHSERVRKAISEHDGPAQVQVVLGTTGDVRRDNRWINEG
jgi:hypothetical protein